MSLDDSTISSFRMQNNPPTNLPLKRVSSDPTNFSTKIRPFLERQTEEFVFAPPPVQTNPVLHNLDQVHSCTIQGTRTKNEDREGKWSYKNGILMALFDGHGGVDMSSWCQQNVFPVFESVDANPYYSDKTWYEKLGQTVINMQDQIKESNLYPNQGTTGILVYITDQNEIHIANIGDSSAFIVDRDNESVMDINTGEYFRQDMMEQEFRQQNIPDDFVPTCFETRPHNYNPSNGTILPDFQYLKNSGVGVRCFGGIYYFRYNGGVRQLELSRAIGDLSCRDIYTGSHIIHKPELYCWKLTSEQIKNASLFLVCDGYNNHSSIVTAKFAQFVSDPLSALRDYAKFTENTWLVKRHPHLSKYIDSTDDIQIQMNMFKSQMIGMIMDDDWKLAVEYSFDVCMGILNDINVNNVKTDPMTVIRFASHLAVVLGSDDNITTMVYNLGA